MHLDQHELHVMPRTGAKFSPLIGKPLSIKGEAPFEANTVYHFRELVIAKAEAVPRGRSRYRESKQRTLTKRNECTSTSDKWRQMTIVRCARDRGLNCHAVRTM